MFFTLLATLIYVSLFCIITFYRLVSRSKCLKLVSSKVPSTESHPPSDDLAKSSLPPVLPSISTKIQNRR